MLKQHRINLLSIKDKTLVRNKEKSISLSKDSEYRDTIQKFIRDNPLNIAQATPEQISNLTKLFISWKGDFFEDKYDYQSHKDKNNIPKEDRYNIHAAIFALCYTVYSLNDSNKFDTDSTSKKIDSNDILALLKTLNNDQKKTSDSISYNKKRTQGFLKEIEEEAAKYIPPNKTKTYRAIKISSIVLASIVALTAGLATGGAIYLLIGSGSTFYTVLAIVVGLFVFKAGVQSNYNFFSSTLSDFFRMVARDELTQYIDKETDKREQMRGFKKFLLGFAFIFALSVGVVSAALLVGSIMGLSALIFPFLGPTVPLVLGSVLGLCYGIALTITMFYAFVKALKNPFSSSEIKLTLRQVLGYFIKGALTALVFFGIGFGCKVSIVTLVTLLSAAFPFISVPVISALCIGLAVVSFIGQVPFAVLSVNKFCNTIVGFFHSTQNSQELKSCDEQEKCGNHFFSILKTYYNITINALGNAALVFIKGSISSIFAVVGSGFYSFSGNMPEPMNKEEQEAHTKRDEFITQYRFGSTEIRSSENASSETENKIVTLKVGKQFFSLVSLPQESTIHDNDNEKENIDDNISRLSHKQ
ncbi:MFS transporter [Rickettsiella massiliensis]|uniref:tripartite tricarboxylate transporter TctB family protein n=1 Tax=Rickettsiella massiliensis TaxID=676517 RepID=UPI00029AACCE|nr:tripartite tricarboxylate transporter TctB family protein [Rickettsiella massiliensis]